MLKNGFLAVGLAVLICGPAQAGVFTVPYEKPALTISVPDRWNPNHSEDGVDAAAPDNAAFFSIYTAQADSAGAVQRDSLAILTRNGMTIKPKPVSEAPASFAGLDWTQSQYAATEDGKPKTVTLDVAPLGAKRYIQLLIWGTPEGVAKNDAALQKIFATIKLKKRQP
jgi:hypothetical protein